MSDEPTRKRARSNQDETILVETIHETNDDAQQQDDDAADDDLLLAQLVDGDDFVTEAQRQEDEARRKRELRRQRLAQMQDAAAAEAVPRTDEPVDNMQVEPTQQQLDEAAARSHAVSLATLTKGAIMDDSVKIETKNNEEDAASKDDDSDDGFDMFSSSVPPVAETKPQEHSSNRPADVSVRGNNKITRHGQADFDDAEGYYKAVIGEIITVEPPSSAGTDEGFTKATKPNRNTAISFRVAG